MTNQITAKQLKEISANKIKEILGNQFSVESGGVLVDDKEYLLVEVLVTFNFGNCTEHHTLIVGWNDIDGVGFEHGENGDIYEITPARIYSQLYFELALKNLDEEFWQ